ncbi:TetR/AcrR family transcriptional regulator [Leucobacter sp. wl10]|uniref:TetR family transcriptional regulator n=1 Tax=Leucobacter sp. wl10 TaxID=2304677 RepID=UPI0013C2ABA8
MIEGAARVFGNFGYEAASLPMIAEASEIPTGSIHFHFSSKEQLALAVLQEQQLRSMSLLRSISALEEGTFSAPSRSSYEDWIESIRAQLAKRRPAGRRPGHVGTVHRRDRASRRRRCGLGRAASRIRSRGPEVGRRHMHDNRYYVSLDAVPLPERPPRC